MIKYSNKLNELMGKDTSVKDLQVYFGFKSTSLIYMWKNNTCMPSFLHLIKLADYFKINIDYLLDISENMEIVEPKKLPKFSEHLKKIIKQQKSSQYKLIQDNIISAGHINSWLNIGSLPSAENLIKLAEYLNVTIDELVGRI